MQTHSPTGDDFPHGHPELDEPVGPGNPDESDLLEAMDTVGQFLSGDDVVIDRDREPVLPPSDPWAPQDQDEVAASGETPLLSAGEAKHQKHARRLEELEQGVLDAIWAEHQFHWDPRFAMMHEVTEKDPDQLSDDEDQGRLRQADGGRSGADDRVRDSGDGAAGGAQGSCSMVCRVPPDDRGLQLMGLWGRFFGKPKVGETKPAPVKPEMVIIEFVCMEADCDFETLSLTDAHQHMIKTADFAGGRTRYHNLEPRGYYYKREPL